ncbi:MAG: hypothetical protein IPK83_17045 [Planctomycetes bacterium]|nr:hypothetical protein [Planctomycetota bacterium]
MQVFLSADDLILTPGQQTTLHVAAQVYDAAPNNGLYAYALNLLLDSTDAGLLQINSITQLGMPDPLFSNSGSIDGSGLHDVFGGDGGFFTDPNRGIGAPYEFLQIELTALTAGMTKVVAEVADNANFIGVPDGFLVQEPGSVNVDFGQSLTIQIVPEPASATGCLLGVLLLDRRRRT